MNEGPEDDRSHPWLDTARRHPWRLLLVPAFLFVSWWGSRPLERGD